MVAMRILILLGVSLLLSISCSSPKKDFYQSLAGNWLLLAPRQLDAGDEKDSTRSFEDSLTSLYGLKLLQLLPDGIFYEIDSLWQPAGSWTFTKDSLLKIEGGGKGFSSFKARFVRKGDHELMLAQSLMYEGAELHLIWTLKKLNDVGEATELFDRQKNKWRQNRRQWKERGR